MRTAQRLAERVYLAMVDRLAELLREDVSESASGLKPADLVAVAGGLHIEAILA